jgi:hypothetical protein
VVKKEGAGGGRAEEGGRGGRDSTTHKHSSPSPPSEASTSKYSYSFTMLGWSSSRSRSTSCRKLASWLDCIAPLRIFFSAYRVPVRLCRTNITAPDKPMPSCFTSSKSLGPRVLPWISASRRWMRRLAPAGEPGAPERLLTEGAGEGVTGGGPGTA